VEDYRKPIPVPSLESKPYWDGLRARRLLIPRCDDCGHSWFPPSRLCPNCNSGRFAWQQVGGRGKVFSFVVFHRVYHPGFTGEVPYVVALIELDEGPRLLSNIVGIPPQNVVCEMPVRFVFEDVAENVTLPKFVPAEAQ
jgi:uncharacterized OB-fold protein